MLQQWIIIHDLSNIISMSVGDALAGASALISIVTYQGNTEVKYLKDPSYHTLGVVFEAYQGFLYALKIAVYYNLTLFTGPLLLPSTRYVGRVRFFLPDERSATLSRTYARLNSVRLENLFTVLNDNGYTCAFKSTSHKSNGFEKYRNYHFVPKAIMSDRKIIRAMDSFKEREQQKGLALYGRKGYSLYGVYRNIDKLDLESKL